MIYKFNNYETKLGVLNGEFEDPNIEVNRATIITNDLTKTITCDVVLYSSNYRVSTCFEDMPRDGQGWDDSDLTTMVGIKLQEFAV